MTELALQLQFLVKHSIQQTPGLLLRLREGVSCPKLLFQILYIWIYLSFERLCLFECFLAFLYTSPENTAAGVVWTIKSSFTTCLYKTQIVTGKVLVFHLFQYTACKMMQQKLLLGKCICSDIHSATVPLFCEMLLWCMQIAKIVLEILYQ